MSTREMIPLSNEGLASLGARLPVPAYDRGALVPSILHVGVGGFHRAHMASYTDELLSKGHGKWCIHGVGLTAADSRMAQTMSAQDGLYTLIARAPTGEGARVVGSIVGYSHHPDGASELCTRAADGPYRIVSMTVTENGYHYTGADRRLDEEHPSIRHDLAEPMNPRSVVGLIFRIAQLRIRSGRTLPTFLSCDNIPHNGSTLRGLVLRFAELVDQETERVLAHQGRFPNCMVDRITPATTDAEREYVTKQWGIKDEWPVVCEEFRQWYIEDDFSDGHPDWDLVGAEFVPDVTPFETMKIRLLNGSHSALAYASYLLGFRRVDQAMQDPDVAVFVREYMAEIEPTVGDVPGVDLSRYCDELVARFSNPAIGDQVLRLTEDGSRKIPNMMLGPIAELLSRGGRVDHAAFALAAWIRFLRGTDETGEPVPIHDPMADHLRTAASRCDHGVRHFIEASGVFPEQFGRNTTLLAEIDSWYALIRDSGTRQALRTLNTGGEDE
jgi:mannitol 2-dehydrogenase